MLLKFHADQSDDRKGKPSASSFHRMVNCIASQPLISFLQEKESLPMEHPDEITDSGSRTHDHLAEITRKMVDANHEIQVVEGLTDDEREEAEELLAKSIKILQEVFGDTWESDDHHVYVEQRFWISHEGELIASGKFDLIVHNHRTDVAVALDYKTGWADTPAGEKNWQLIGAAVMVNQDLWVERCHIAIVETHVKIEVAELNLEAIAGHRKTLVNAIVGAATGDPIRLPYNPTYKNCRYCPAILRCPLAQYQTKEAATSILTEEITNDMLEACKDACDTAVIFEKHVVKEMAFRARNGTQFFDYEYSSSPGKRKVEDSATVCKMLMGMGALAGDVFDKVKIAVGDAEKLHKAATGLKGKACSDDFVEKFQAFIVKDTPDPTIKRRKP